MPPRLRRAAAASTVIAGLGLLGVSVTGIAAMQSDLEAAARPASPSPLVDGPAPVPVHDDRPCRRPAPDIVVAPGV